MSVISEPERIITKEQLESVVNKIPPIIDLTQNTKENNTQQNLKSNKQPSQQPVQQVSQQPVQQVSQQPVQQPLQQIVQQPLQQIVQQPLQQIVQQPLQQPVQQPILSQLPYQNLPPEMQQQFLAFMMNQTTINNNQSTDLTHKLKRRRSIDDSLYREIRSKTDTERRNLESLSNDSKSTQKLHMLFNNLQSLSTSLGIPIETPEIVVVGMQSDGKSSFIEALVGFQFNVVESTIGTRRPLILQMINDSKKRTPKCCFANENGIFEEREVPIDYLNKEISNRTCDVAGRQNVSSKPLILRVEFSGCSNLTIIDTPGFRLGGEEILKNDILQMVKDLILPPHRIIVCLEQSTTEWANSVSRPIVKEVDPEFKRTILVNTKFDNRVKELVDRESVDRYLEGDKLIIGEKKPFFISLPCKRNISMDQFSDYIMDSYISDYRSLLEIEFDEAKYINQIGFQRVKIYLENLLQQKYKESLQPTSIKLSQLVIKSNREINSMEQEIIHVDPSLLRKRSVKFIQLFTKTISQMVDGEIGVDPLIYGQTLQEENPSLSINDNLKLCGGAQINRMLKAYETKLKSLSFHSPSNDEVMSAFGMGSNCELASRIIVMNIASKEIKPLIEEIIKSICNIVLRFFDISTSVIHEHPNDYYLPENNPNDLFQIDIPQNNINQLVVGLIRFEGFINTLKQGFTTFIEKLKYQCCEKLNDDFEACVKSVDSNYNLLNNNSNNKINEVIIISEHLFEEIKERMILLVISKIKTFIVNPLKYNLLSWLLDGFLELDIDKYEKLFNFNEEAMRKQIEQLKQQHLICQKNLINFNAMIKELENFDITTQIQREV